MMGWVENVTRMEGR